MLSDEGVVDAGLGVVNGTGFLGATHATSHALEHRIPKRPSKRGRFPVPPYGKAKSGVELRGFEPRPSRCERPTHDQQPHVQVLFVVAAPQVREMSINLG